MAKDFDAFSKSFKAIDKTFDGLAAEIKKNAGFVAQTSGLIAEGVKVLGGRIQELKDGGMTGTALSDFIADAEVKAIWKSVESHLSGLEKELKRIADLHAGEGKGTIKELAALKKDLAAEIAKRKKEVSTKLGAGNKSLPDMEKLLKEIDAYEEKSPFTVVGYFQPETIADHRKQVDRDLLNEIKKAKDVKLTEEQKMLDEQALNVRNLTANVGRAKTLHDGILKTCEDAKKAIKGRDQKALMTAKAELPKPLKALGDLAQIGERALKDTWIKRGIESSKDKGKILAGIKAIAEFKKAASEAVKEVANARL